MKLRKSAIILAALFAMASMALAAVAPDRINYQGVLRDGNDKPLDGYFDMTFRFWNAATKGDEILIDEHLSHDAVSVSGGVFSVAIGSGLVSDGSGPGVYTSLAEVFRDYENLWLEVQVGSETLKPRTEIASSGYAFNSTHLGGRPAAEFIDTSSSTQAKSGKLIAGATSGTSMEVGVEGFGAFAGGYFENSDSSGYAWIGRQNKGIWGFGTQAGGVFENNDDTGEAWLGYGRLGIFARGNLAGGEFHDGDSSAVAWVAIEDTGILARGNDSGGEFSDLDSSGHAWTAYGDVGVEGHGNYAGGVFEDSDSSGLTYVAREGLGIRAYGNEAGGYFSDRDSSGIAWAGQGDVGVRGIGDYAGGVFEDGDSSGAAYVGRDDRGIWAYGNTMGGYFRDETSFTYLYAANGSSSTYGNGAKNFVQNHPQDSGALIVYAALEGDEVGTYTRGTARLAGGIAHVRLGETFKWVTNPDIGLTAQVTPRGAAVPLAVTSLTTEELVVEGPPDGPSDLAFDYVVHGLRIGFEQVPAVKPKRQGEEAFIPSMSDERELLAERPELERYTALKRFVAMRNDTFPGSGAKLDTSRAEALVAAIHEYDPATDGRIAPPEPLEPNRQPADDPADLAMEEAPLAPAAPVSALDQAVSLAVEPPQEQIAETKSTTELPPGAAWLPVIEPVEEGDLLALDPNAPGTLRRAASIADPGVVGVATAVSRPATGEPGGREVGVLASGFCELKADAGFGAIRSGDLLTSSPTPGHAMRAIETVTGTILGKAIEPLEAGTGTIRVLLLMR